MLTGKGAIIERMVAVSGLSRAAFCKKHGITSQELTQAVRKNIVSKNVIRAIEEEYGSDYSWLEKEDGRCTKSTKRRLTN